MVNIIDVGAGSPCPIELKGKMEKIK